MTLIERYATLLRSLNGEAVDRFFLLLKKKGHLSLLPRILKKMEQFSRPEEIVTVSKEEDISRLKERFPHATFRVDPDIVQGYIYRNGTDIIDRSTRSKLVRIYQKTVGIQ